MPAERCMIVLRKVALMEVKFVDPHGGRNRNKAKFFAADEKGC